MPPAGFLHPEDMQKGEGGDSNDSSKFDISKSVIMIGNFGDGRINVYTIDGQWLGQLQTHNRVITIPGLWALGFAPTTATAINPQWLFFTAGPNMEMDGVWGYLVKQ
jgi:hypothetical protein